MKAQVEGRGRKLILATHLGIWDDKTPSWLRSAKDAVSVGLVRWLMDANKIEHVLAGNWHEGQIFRYDDQDVTGRITIPGTLAPNGFHGIPHHKLGFMHVLDSSVGRFHRSMFHIPGPRFTTTDMRGLCDFSPAEAFNEINGLNPSSSLNPTAIFIRARVPANRVAEANEVIANACRDPRVRIVLEVSDESPIQAAVNPVTEAGAVDLASYAEGKIVEPATIEGVRARLDEYRKRAMAAQGGTR